MPLSVVDPIVPVLVPAPVVLKATTNPPVVRLLPAASFACRVKVAVAPDTTVPLEVVTNDCAVVAGPGVTVMVGKVDVTATPPIVALIVFAVPASTPVNVAVYVPFPLSVVDPIVPVLVPAPVVLKTTVEPPVVRSFPAASLAWSVNVAVDPETTVASEVVTTDWAVLIAPGVTVIVGNVDVTGLPPMVALMVLAVPARTPVNVAV